MTRFRSFPLVVSLTLAGGVGSILWSCAGAAGVSVINTVLNAARKTFLGVATDNYGDKYKEDFDKLLGLMTKEMAPKDPNAPPAAPPGGAPPPAPAPGQPAPAPAPGAPGTPVAAGSPPPPPGGAPPPAPPPVAPPLAPLTLDVVLLKEQLIDGRSVPVPVQDGETLYDPYGTHGKGDNLKISFRTNADCYVYVLSIDTTALVQPVFPSAASASSNPVKPNQTYQIPEGSNWFPLDSYRGVEHLYFLASRTPRPDLEKQLVVLTAYVREADPKRAAENEKPADQRVAMASVQDAAPIARGLGQVRKSVVPDVKSTEGQNFNVDAQVFGAQGNGDIMVTRWFRHE